EVPEGKLDLFINNDIRMTASGLYSAAAMPAATSYKNRDLTGTDIQASTLTLHTDFTPPGQAASDWDAFKALAKKFSEMAETYFPEPVHDLVTTPLMHDTKDEIGQAYGTVPDWKYGKYDPIPGVNFPRVQVVERDFRK